MSDEWIMQRYGHIPHPDVLRLVEAFAVVCEALQDEPAATLNATTGDLTALARVVFTEVVALKWRVQDAEARLTVMQRELNQRDGAA